MHMSFREKVGALVACTTLLALGAAAPAIAEGSWSSSISGGSAVSGGGFSSRWWTDNHRDSAATSLAMSTCRVTTTGIVFHSVQQILFRDNGIFPDHNHGTGVNACNGSAVSWGVQAAAGSYRWALGEMRVYTGSSTPWTSGYRVNVSSVTTRY